MFSPDNTGGFLRAFSNPASAAQAAGVSRASRCYRTSAEGRIGLRPDWPLLLETARGLGRVVVQTRHGFARLIAVTDIPGFVVRKDGGAACAEDGTLSFRFSEWRRAWGWLTACPCCGSPARVEVWNACPLPFLQICAPAQGGLEGWAGVFDALATDTGTTAATTTGTGSGSSAATDTAAATGDDTATDEASATTAADTPATPDAHFHGIHRAGAATDTAGADGAVPAPSGGVFFPKTPRDAHVMRFDEDLLLGLLASLDRHDLPVRWILRTPEACHAREFAPRRAGIAQRTLTIKDGTGHTLQLGLPAARAFALGTGADRSLYIGGQDDSLLLEMAPPADPALKNTWRAVVHGVFSEWQ
jgi:hypothetical protein